MSILFAILWSLVAGVLVTAAGLAMLAPDTRHAVWHALGWNRRTSSIQHKEDNDDWVEVGERCVKCGKFEKWFDWNPVTDERNYDA